MGTKDTAWGSSAVKLLCLEPTRLHWERRTAAGKFCSGSAVAGTFCRKNC